MDPVPSPRDVEDWANASLHGYHNATESSTISLG